MRLGGKLKEMAYEDCVENGKRIYKIYKNGEVILQGPRKEMRFVPQRLIDDGLSHIADDMVETLPSLYKATCTICGNEFVGVGKTQYTCSEECKKEYARRVQSRYRPAQRRKEQIADAKESDGVIAEVSKKARDLGMSYGKYVAMKWIEAGNARVEV